MLDSYITIQGWMRSELGLKGNDLLVYAIIYGFSMKENQKFYGGLQYLADWCGATKYGVSKNLKNLIDLGLIEKEDCVIGGVKTCKYWCTTQLHGMQHSCMGYATELHGIQHSCTNNIYNNIKKKKKKEIIKKNIPNLTISQFVESYTKRCSNLRKIYNPDNISEKRKKAILSLTKKYSMAEIEKAFDMANQSDFLTGKVKDFKADIDFILREDKFISILEGKYNTKKKSVTKLNTISKEKKERRKESVKKRKGTIY